MGHPTMQENDTAKLTPTFYKLLFLTATDKIIIFALETKSKKYVCNHFCRYSVFHFIISI